EEDEEEKNLPRVLVHEDLQDKVELEADLVQGADGLVRGVENVAVHEDDPLDQVDAEEHEEGQGDGHAVEQAVSGQMAEHQGKRVDGAGQKFKGQAQLPFPGEGHPPLVDTFVHQEDLRQKCNESANGAKGSGGLR
ncbi:hypothetical protein scyTo_0022781, partial [Scyliorhinus torazame]|nr:hypothetical protein [Scyliorhinus torazame]